jgi:hypothetical protein
MQFKHPELLYALFLLIIPILVHLFQLRKFQKTPFTNVAFLQKIVLQTRKSSQLKKWLLLFTRMLALAFLIFAFSQPFLPAKDTSVATTETVLYIDNSFSMEARGPNGPLLERVRQQLFEEPNLPQKLSWFTNTETHKEVEKEDFKNDVLQIPYTSKQLTVEELLLQAENIFSKSNVQKQLLIISDFQGWENFPEISNSEMAVKAVKLQPVSTANISIDSVFVSATTSTTMQLTAILKRFGNTTEETTVSLFENETLLAKTSTNFENSNSSSVIFEIESQPEFEGKLQITDQNLLYDNDLYFNISKNSKIKVLSINQQEDLFLHKIFTNDDFEFTTQDYKQPDYSTIANQNLVILNELDELPESLSQVLREFVENGGSLLIIPSEYKDETSFNKLLQHLQFGIFEDFYYTEKKITNINFNHPLLQHVFEKEVRNFQYPKVEEHYGIKGNFSTVVSYQDNTPFLAEKNGVYVFTSSLQPHISNFKSSPLIVPVLYNIGKNSLQLPSLYFSVGNENIFDINLDLKKDRVLKISQANGELIPMQQNLANKVRVTTLDEPNTAGTYAVLNDKETVAKVSYNYPRSQSDLSYADLNKWPAIEVYNSVTPVFEKAIADSSLTFLWKFCLIFALVFMLIEMLLLKFLR